MDKITTINGILLAAQNELNEHVENGTAHVTEEERTAWNAKADSSALATKLNSSTFTAHQSDSTIHITAEEREKWNEGGLQQDVYGYPQIEGNHLTIGSRGYSVTFQASEDGGYLHLSSSSFGKMDLQFADLADLAAVKQPLLDLVDAARVSLTVPNDSISCPAEGGGYDVQAKTNSPQPLTVTRADEWIAVTIEGNVIQLAVAANTGGAARTGHVSVMAQGPINSSTVSLTVEQQG